MKKKIVIWTAIVLASFVGVIAGWIGYMASPIKGAIIEKYTSPRTANPLCRDGLSHHYYCA